MFIFGRGLFKWGSSDGKRVAFCSLRWGGLVKSPYLFVFNVADLRFCCGCNWVRNVDDSRQGMGWEWDEMRFLVDMINI